MNQTRLRGKEDLLWVCFSVACAAVCISQLVAYLNVEARIYHEAHVMERCQTAIYEAREDRSVLRSKREATLASIPLGATVEEQYAMQPMRPERVVQLQVATARGE